MKQPKILVLTVAIIISLLGSAIETATSPADEIHQKQLLLLERQSPQNGKQQQEQLDEFSTSTDPVTPAVAIDLISSTLSSNADIDTSDLSAFSPDVNLKIKPCSLSGADLNECILKLFKTIAPKLKNTGLSEYNMISVDPYFYKRGIFRYANDGVQGGLLIKNMNIHGISALKLNSVLSNFTDNGGFIIKLGVELPHLRADGQFKADVKFGGLRLVPKGPFNITIDDVKATVLTDGVIEESENGGKRVRLHRLNANVNIGDARIIANGIFSDRNLNAMILNLVNENLPEITRVGIPATREQWAPILVEHINDFFAQVPIEKLLVQ